MIKRKIDTSDNLYDYLLHNAPNPYIINLLQYEINKRIYYFGNNFSNSWEKLSSQKNSRKQILEVLYKILKSKTFKNNTNLILSNAYFSVNDTLRDDNLEVIVPWWCLKKGSYLRNYCFLHLIHKLSKSINNAGIRELVSEDLQKNILSFIEAGNSLVAKSKIRAGFFSNDLGFYERAFIDILKKQNVPTFIFLHGLPARYNDIDDNRTNYLIVWGDKIKENYIKAGIEENKIIVSGHPFYKNFKSSILRFSFENILVISKPANGTPSISNDIILSDRGNCLLYLELVRRTLESYGVKKVKLRIHPSENPKWYCKNIDTNFYSLDTDSLKNSLVSSSLVIGPASTVLLESIYYGVNYIVYEPSLDKMDLINYPIVPPFDGSDAKIPVAKNEDELKLVLKNKIGIDSTCFHDYISTNFDLSFVKNLIK